MLYWLHAFPLELSFQPLIHSFLQPDFIATSTGIVGPTQFLCGAFHHQKRVVELNALMFHLAKRLDYSSKLLKKLLELY